MYSFRAGILLLLLSIQLSSFAQQDQSNITGEVNIAIPEVAILDLESATGTSINLVLNVRDEAGVPIDVSEANDSTIWLNYSSIKGKGKDGRRDVYASVTSGQIPSGFQLRLKALADAGKGDGTLGTPKNEIVMGTKPRKIIRSIGSCYTGNGVGSGHRLVYRLMLKNNQLDRVKFDESGTLTILYTFSED